MTIRELDKLIRKNISRNVYHDIQYDTTWSGKVTIRIDFKWWFCLFFLDIIVINKLSSIIENIRPTGIQICIKSI
jgi:hypothetical protein